MSNRTRLFGAAALAGFLGSVSAAPVAVSAVVPLIALPAATTLVTAGTTVAFVAFTRAGDAKAASAPGADANNGGPGSPGSGAGSASGGCSGDCGGPGQTGGPEPSGGPNNGGGEGCGAFFSATRRVGECENQKPPAPPAAPPPIAAVPPPVVNDPCIPSPAPGTPEFLKCFGYTGLTPPPQRRRVVAPPTGRDAHRQGREGIIPQAQGATTPSRLLRADGREPARQACRCDRHPFQSRPSSIPPGDFGCLETTAAPLPLPTAPRAPNPPFETAPPPQCQSYQTSKPI